MYIFILLLLLCEKFPSSEQAGKAVSSSKASCECGKSGATTRIVGGKLSGNHLWPWMAALVYSGGATPSQFCGGSLINDRYVLTAGHCIYGKTGVISSYQVFLGSNKINGTDAKRNNIAAIILHPNYDPQTLDNDIALIRLLEPVKFSPRIRPVCLAHGGGGIGKMANIAGWGTLSKGGNPVNQLRDAWIRVIDNAKCQKSYSQTNVRITGNMLCASSPGRDSCSGDSGGPLTIKEANTFRQYGVVSFGVDCGNSSFPGVYARVTKYRGWLMENTRDGRYCNKG